MPSLWPPSGFVPKPEMTRPLTGQRKLLPVIGSGLGSWVLLATRCGSPPVISGAASAVLCALPGSGAAPGAGIVVVFTLRTPDGAVSAWATDGAAVPAGMMSFWPIWSASARTSFRARMAFSLAPSFSAMP